MTEKNVSKRIFNVIDAVGLTAFAHCGRTDLILTGRASPVPHLTQRTVVEKLSAASADNRVSWPT